VPAHGRPARGRVHLGWCFCGQGTAWNMSTMANVRLDPGAPRAGQCSRGDRTWATESLVTAGLACVGLAISTYLTVAHYSDVPLVCSTTDVIDCASVTRSSYSQLAGIPVSVVGLAWFAVVCYCGVASARRGAAGPWLALQLVLGLAAMGFVLYLIYAELVRLHRICEWCTAVHLLTFVIFLLTVIRMQRQTSGSHEGS
jgi:uncharacterized membrane protein